MFYNFILLYFKVWFKIENFNHKCSFYELHTYHLVQYADRSAIKRTRLLSKKEFRAVWALVSTHLRHPQPIGLLRSHVTDLVLLHLAVVHFECHFCKRSEEIENIT